jgi:RimJ/RimL family protein N-acetyltransferase
VKPVVLVTERLVLDQPGDDDIDTITEFCVDPVFEKYLTTPWPYRREHAEGFVRELIPNGWASDSEYTWALRLGPSEPLLGVIGIRTDRQDLGFWMGAPHRGHGYLPEAAHAVIDWSFEHLGFPRVIWEAFVGNRSSAAVARKLGFTYGGVGRAEIPARDDSRPEAWHGILYATDSRDEKPGWP